ncbi:hypothetical protein PRIPAC_96699 [Pristionchus pacificus]|uniref:Uncharacterized protein n=1 Tax=Pristionchus pacificus TaxID=54126 RepID=A0A2A6BJ24_PRIPA|nr:hypothetical protein PRIPAC_96699 [Pristionchus pacificus]|eukprot:PDM65801.1 hypothetical protein PRIPAC_45202 [Pristionchus pacificus]
MELSSIWLLLLILIPVADTCIPTKTPEPGIPATPKPETCPALPKYPVADCTTDPGTQGFVCAEAMITSTSVTCAAPGSSVYQDHFLNKSSRKAEQHTSQNRPDYGSRSANDNARLAAPLMCVGTEWTDQDGNTFIDFAGVSSAPVACVKTP